MAALPVLRLWLAAMAVAVGSPAPEQWKASEQTNAQALLLPELLGALDTSFAADVQRDLPQLQAELQHTLSALSVDEQGHHSATAVRYALHRLFLKRHGWSIVGLDPEGQAWNQSWPNKVTLLNKAPEAARKAVLQRLEGTGLGSQDVSSLAMLLLHLVRKAVAERLHAIFVGLQLPLDGEVQLPHALDALNTHVASFVLAVDPTALHPLVWLARVSSVEEAYPSWPKLRNNVRQIFYREVQGNTTTFVALARVAALVGEEWGHWEQADCSAMKKQLLPLEEGSSGRVRLADFYGQALHEGQWQLGESETYLRQLGALDESNPRSPRVIIVNYVNGASNCVASSSSFALCCISECEAVMGHLEEKLRAPVATAAEVAEAVGTIGTATVPADRQLSGLMLNRLNGIAAANGGVVPLHGRLLAQWLHHAFPRECPFPHLAGSTRPLQVEVFASTGNNVTASPEQMEARATVRPRASQPLESVRWQREEELFVELARRPTAWATLQCTVFAVALAVVTFGMVLVRAARAGRKALQQTSSKLYEV